MNIPRLILLALAFLIVFPMPIFGIYVHGGILNAILLAVLYTVVLHIIWWLVEISWFLTLGLSIIATVFLFWLIPALALFALGWALPEMISVTSIFGAVIAGLVVMGINKLTN